MQATSYRLGTPKLLCQILFERCVSGTEWGSGDASVVKVVVLPNSNVQLSHHSHPVKLEVEFYPGARFQPRFPAPSPQFPAASPGPPDPSTAQATPAGGTLEEHLRNAEPKQSNAKSALLGRART